MLRALLLGTVIMSAIVSTVAADENDNLGAYLQSISVNVKAGLSQGSGTLIIIHGEEGNDNARSVWVLTAAHVVSGLRKVDTRIDGGRETKIVRYDDAVVVQEQISKGRSVGTVSYDAKVINVDSDRDIALLRVRKDDAFLPLGEDIKRIDFYLGEHIPGAGTGIYHCGAPGGFEVGGTATLTHGIISRVGVKIVEYGGSEFGIFDQTDCAALPGSSGGMVVRASDGKWVGMITLGLRSSSSFHWFVPVRSVKEWAKEIGAEWLLNHEIKKPKDEDFMKKVMLELSRAPVNKSDN